MHSTTDYASSNKQWRLLVLSGRCMVVSVKSGKCTKWHMWWFACFCIFPKVEISLFDCNVSIEHVKSGGIHPHAILHKMTYIMICAIHGPHVKVTVAYSHLLALEPPYFWCTTTQQKVDQIVWIPLYRGGKVQFWTSVWTWTDWTEPIGSGLVQVQFSPYPVGLGTHPEYRTSSELVWTSNLGSNRWGQDVQVAW